MLNIQPVRSKDFTWDLGLNYAYNKSKVVELDPSVRYVYLGGPALPFARLFLLSGKVVSMVTFMATTGNVMQVASLL